MNEFDLSDLSSVFAESEQHHTEFLGNLQLAQVAVLKRPVSTHTQHAAHWSCEYHVSWLAACVRL